MNLSLERFYRQFSGEPLTLQTVIDKIRDGSFRLYIPTPQSEDQPGTIAQIKGFPSRTSQISSARPTSR